MKTTGIVRRIDDLGRIVIPREIRERIFGTRNCEGKPMELFMDGDSIVLRKYEAAEMRKEQEIRNKAIDEFADELINHSISADTGKGNAVKMEWVSPVTKIREVAEQMKGGSE